MTFGCDVYEKIELVGRFVRIESDTPLTEEESLCFHRSQSCEHECPGQSLCP